MLSCFTSGCVIKSVHTKGSTDKSINNRPLMSPEDQQQLADMVARRVIEIQTQQAAASCKK